MKEYFAQNQASDVLQKLNLDRLSGGKTCDIQLKCGQEKFHAHKIVLSQVSEYFEKLFYSEMKEKYNDTVGLNSIDGKTLSTILDFVYTAKITISTDDVFDILTAANYFLIKPIHEYCCDYILDILHLNNSVQVWLKVQKFDIDTLVEGCDKYLKENFSNLTDISTIHSLDFSTFKSFIATRSKDIKGEERAFQCSVSWVKHDLEERRHLFPQLFELIDLKLLSHEFFSYGVAFEELVREFIECLQRFSKHVKYIFGPLNKDSNIMKMLDIKAGVESEIAKRNKVRLQTSFVVHKNYLYMVGGLTTEKLTNSVLRMDLRCQSKGWENQPSMVCKRSNAGVCVIGDVMFAFGGCAVDDDENKIWTVPEKLKIGDTKNKWTQIKQYKKCSLDLISCKGVFYTMCYPLTLTCEKYDPVTETSTLMPNLPVGCVKLLAMEDQLYVIWKSGEKLSLSKYDPESGRSHQVSKIDHVGEFRDACAAHGQIVVSYESSKSQVVCISTYDFDAKEWNLVVESEDLSNYWKLVPYQNNPFE